MNSVPLPWFRCSCGKRGYSSRKMARRARAGLPGENLHIYQCPSSHAPSWHLGHLHEPVVRGELTKGQYYGPRGVGRIRHAAGKSGAPAA